MTGHGGRRPGAGRPKGKTEPLPAVAIRLSPELRERLRWVAETLGCSQAEIVEMGIEAAEKQAAKR